MRIAVKNPWIATLLNIAPLGFGYIYLGHFGRFAGTFLWGVAAIFMGLVLGPVIVDGVLAGLDDCPGAFSPSCPRPVWAYAAMIFVWVLPMLLIAVLTTRGAYRRAVDGNVALRPDHRRPAQAQPPS